MPLGLPCRPEKLRVMNSWLKSLHIKQHCGCKGKKKVSFSKAFYIRACLTTFLVHEHQNLPAHYILFPSMN